MEFKHISVLLDECIENLNIKPCGTYVDGTLGGAGHSSKIVERLTTGRLIGIDRDDAALAAASERLGGYEHTFIGVRGNYSDISSILLEQGIKEVDGILLDLGVSSYQLDTPDRGFSYSQNAPLDMRMDRRQSLTAKEIVNTYSGQELTRIFRDYGEERFAANISKHILKNREEKTIETTDELNQIIRAAIPAKTIAPGSHPSKRVFQALRIEVNGELEGLKRALDDMIDALAPGGRLCIITFHSLEDRLVKTAFKTAENPCICPPNFPQCVCGRKSKGRVVSRKPILPTKEELENNKRSKSAKLRVFEKSI